MPDFFRELLSTSSFMPHGHCYLWRPDILWTSVGSDLTIAIAYYAIPPVLFLFARKKKDLPFVWMFTLFCVFILLCGTTHVLDIYTIWHPVYRLLVLTKLVTAVTSIATAVLLVPLIPKALSLRSPRELEETNLALIHEMREREKAEKLVRDQQVQITQSAKMSALGEMAGGVAHEINNPLATIKTRASQMAELLGDKEIDVATLREMAEEIERTTDRMAKIVHGMRSFCRDTSGDKFAPVSVQRLVQESLGLCAERYRNHGISLTVGTIDPALNFEGNQTQISQVLLNLLNNAHDAVAGKPKPWVSVEVRDEPDKIAILVTDSGSGVPNEIRAKIFQPFFTTKSIGDGTGLGLSVSIGIVQKHGGELSLDTGHPRTRFVVRLSKLNGRQEAA